MADGLELRAARRADAEAIRRLVREVLAEYGLRSAPSSTDADLVDPVASYAEVGGRFDVLVDADGVVVGTVGLLPVDRQTIELRKMYLRPAHRGRGWGRRLLEHALGTARALGARRMVLETATQLTEAIALYRSRGFVPYEAEHLSGRCDQAYELWLEPTEGEGSG